MSAAGRALSKALESPDDWDVPTEYRIVHRPTEMSFWTANGSFWFNGSEIHGTPSCIGLIERHWLYFKARKVRAKLKPPVKDHGAEVVRRFEKERNK